MCILTHTRQKADKKNRQGSESSFTCDCTCGRTRFRPGEGRMDSYLMISISRDSTTKMAAAIFVPSASLASKVLDLDLLK